MATQIESLTQSITDLQTAQTALAARVAAIQPAPDLSGAITGIQGVTASLNTLLPTPEPTPSQVVEAPVPTA